MSQLSRPGLLTQTSTGTFQTYDPASTVHADIEAWLATYRPRDVPASLWEGELGRVVRDLVVAIAPVGVPVAQRYARVLARLARWCVLDGVPLDPELMLDPETVERFVTVGLRDAPSRGTYRADLRRVAPRLTRNAPWPPLPERTTHRSVAMPYTKHEMERLWRDILVQPTPARMVAGKALFVLGAGAGLDGRWNVKVRGTDVRRLREGVVVDVPPPVARTVPVLADYDEEVLALADLACSNPLVGSLGRGKNAASNLQARLVMSATSPRLSGSRLRSTWLVTHLGRGTRLPELVDAAGLSGLTGLSDLLPDVARLPSGEAMHLLTGRES